MPPNQPVSASLLPEDQAPHGFKGKRAPVKIKIDNEWYDLTNWQQVHPGGERILQHLHGVDATDAFYSLHSAEAVQRMKRLPKCSAPIDAEPAFVVARDGQPAVYSDPSRFHANFRAFRQELQEEGWFKRNPLWDAFYIGAVLFLIAMGIYIARSYPFIATILIGVAMEQAGWLGHDYVHGRGLGSWILGRLLGAGINGFSSEWWSQKHNTHHVYPNRLGIDTDIEMDPVFYLWYPNESEDVVTRKYQHVYFIPVCAVLYLSWRWQSILHAINNQLWLEVLLITLNYTWLFYFLPWYVVFGSMAVGGWLVAIVVTASHQSEELLPKNSVYSFVLDQFASTRNAHTTNPLMNWLWGGMQYQLEHHLFPTMPKYRYGALSARVQQFAKENGIEYKVDGVWQLLRRNLHTLTKYSQPLETTRKSL